MPSPRWLKATCHIACILEKRGGKKRNGLCCPQQSCPRVHLWERELDGRYCSGAVGPAGNSTAVSLPAVLSAAEAANREGENECWEAAELPPARSTPSPLAPGANALCEQRKHRSVLQLLLPPSSSPRKKMVNVILHQIGL